MKHRIGWNYYIDEEKHKELDKLNISIRTMLIASINTAKSNKRASISGIKHKIKKSSIQTMLATFLFYRASLPTSPIFGSNK